MIPPRPAIKSALNALPLVKVDANSKDCAICIDTIEAGLQATQLPCQHLFHRDCITHWLSNRRNISFSLPIMSPGATS
ncbi:hypothetical protein KP509_35G016500 [Ceratopteris richardii]|uniref:RING-type domain-containing protein n=1 Tax=Ceratopteris richardii TaxID=49495 RepID=A0A8T2QG92_CERRI|nr:hypothetical protein KP509_35G016500 [Ceratopteris richardii]